MKKKTASEIDLQITVGQAVANARKQQKLSQHQLSQITGCSVANISNMERGNVLPSLPILIPVFAHLNLSMDEIFLKRSQTSMTPASLKQS